MGKTKRKVLLIVALVLLPVLVLGLAYPYQRSKFIQKANALFDPREKAFKGLFLPWPIGRPTLVGGFDPKTDSRIAMRASLPCSRTGDFHPISSRPCQAHHEAGAEDGGIPVLPRAGRARPAASDPHCYRDMKLHSILFGWSDPDQALRVAAGILGKRASDGLRPSGHYCQRCEAFLTKYRTWEPQSGVGLELEDMVKTN